jgi:hypothetical protein
VSSSGSVWTIDNTAVSYAKIQDVAANSFLANVTGSPASMQAIATTRIPLFASAITGTPSSTTYLRGDGLWTIDFILSANSNIQLPTFLSTTDTYSGVTKSGIAAVNLVFGDLVYLVGTKWSKVNASVASTSGEVIIGMCVLAAVADATTTILFYGTVRADLAFPTMTIGAPMYASTTAGNIQVAQPSATDEAVRRIGFALTADELFFNPSNDYATVV